MYGFVREGPEIRYRHAVLWWLREEEETEWCQSEFCQRFQLPERGLALTR